MNENNPIKSIINLYFGKHFSKYGRILFGRWLKAETDYLQKGQAMKDLWTETQGTPTEETYQDWEKLYNSLPITDTRKAKSISIYQKSLNYAAVGALMILSASVTYWITSQSRLMETPEMTYLSVPYGENREILLPDGSTARVDAGSSLIYPKDFSNTKTRTIYLSGEASFSVRKNQEQPFIVKTSFVDVQALGTVFSIEAYAGDSLSKTTLKEGSVLVSISEGNMAPTVLKPNQQLVYSHTERTATVQDIDASLYDMERDGYLIFEHVSFDRLILILERKFNVTIHYNSQKYMDAGYNVKFSPRESLEDILDILSELIGIRYSIKGKTVIIN